MLTPSKAKSNSVNSKLLNLWSWISFPILTSMILVDCIIYQIKDLQREKTLIWMLLLQIPLFPLPEMLLPQIFSEFIPSTFICLHHPYAISSCHPSINTYSHHPVILPPHLTNFIFLYSSYYSWNYFIIYWFIYALPSVI